MRNAPGEEHQVQHRESLSLQMIYETVVHIKYHHPWKELNSAELQESLIKIAGDKVRSEIENTDSMKSLPGPLGYLSMSDEPAL